MESDHLDGRIRNNIQIGQEVDIIQKQHQKSQELTTGIIKQILTNAEIHHRGIKVRLESGEIGRVKNIL
ncbi:MAG: YwbE family protein [Bacteroidota bacterium]